jgi:hypothetical protein
VPVELTIVESVTELETTVVEVVLESASAPGPAGADGQGVPTGGTTGQRLAKASNADFDTEWADAGTPGAHASSHENGGADEIDVTGLSGVLADAQTPASHAHAGEDITSGTIADARIASTIARDSEVSSAISTSEAGQVRDGDAAGGVLGGTYPNPSFAADMATQAELDAHTGDTSAAHAASAISFTPEGSISATDVQAAIQEVRDEAGGGGAPTDVDYLVGTASGGLSAEIVVGTSPGGELGGTWGSPTVDATHSGSSHAAVQAAAEATAAGALATHAADTTSVHGIADTSALALTANAVMDGDTAGGVLSGTYPSPGFAADMATQAELDAHVSDSSAAHAASAISADSTTLVGTATDVQGVLEELDNGIADHLADSSAAHAATAISFTPAGTIAATDVQAAIEEVANEAGGGGAVPDDENLIRHMETMA